MLNRDGGVQAMNLKDEKLSAHVDELLNLHGPLALMQALQQQSIARADRYQRENEITCERYWRIVAGIAASFSVALKR